MQNFTELETNIKSIIDDLKGLCSTNGLSNTAGEEIVVTSVFLYKFLNDKFINNLHKFAKELGISYDELIANKEDYMDGFYDTYPQDVAFAYEDTIDYLVQSVGNNDFYKMFDDTLVRISGYPQNDAFNIDTSEGTKKPLFTPLSTYVEPSKRNAFAQNIFSYITRDRFDFGIANEGNYDFFSTIFEYLISDYNVASGKYAEYFTPQALSSAIGKILVHMSPIKDTIYDIKKLYNSLFNMKSFLQNERISNFLSCNYRGRYDYIGIDNREYIYLESGKKDDNESIFIDKINGNVYNNKLKPLLNSSGEHLDIISFNNQELGILNEEVNLILLNRSYDIELRNKLLNLVIYKILYSKESTMDINYKRAICYINEITKIFPDLNVEKDTLDNYRFVKVKR